MISKPSVNITIASATSVLDIGGRKNLIISQTPGATVNALVTGVQDLTQTELDTLLGAGSYARVMVQQWLDANRIGNNVRAELDVITLLDDVAATAATKTITVVGTASAAGNIDVSILSAKLYTATIAVASSDTETQVADKITAAYAGVVAPFTVGNASGVVTVTATDLGTIGNDYGIEISNLVAGITSITVASGVTGANPPTVTDVMDLVGANVRYQGILWPTDLEAALSEVTDFLDARFNVANNVLDGVAFMGKSDTLANLKSAVNALNVKSLVVPGEEITPANALKSGPEVVHPVDWTAATFMGIRARRLTQRASIRSVVVVN